jgi:hypothetical protein
MDARDPNGVRNGGSGGSSRAPMHHDVMSALGRRVSEMQRQRMRHLFAAVTRCQALKQMAAAAVPTTAGDVSDDDDDADGSPRKPRDPTKPKQMMLERPSRRTVVDALAAVCQYAFHAPRFVFICGSEGRILRSGDRCRTWRAMAVQGAVSTSTSGDAAASITETNVERDAPEGTLEALATSDATRPSQKAAKPKGRDQVADILALLPPRSRAIAAGAIGGERGKELAAGSAATVAKKTRDVKERAEQEATLDLFAIDAHGPSGHIAACGAGATLLYSSTRGTTFVPVPVRQAVDALFAASGASKGSGSDSDDNDNDDAQSVATSARFGVRGLRHVAVLSPGRLVVAAGRLVVFLHITTGDGGQRDPIAVKAAHILVEMPADVRLIAKTNRTESHGEIIVSCAKCLEIIYLPREFDGAVSGRCAASFRVGHRVGTILALVELPAEATASIPPPQPLKAAVSSLVGKPGATSRTAFSYAADSVVTEAARQVFNDSAFDLVAASSDAHRRGRCFAAYCSAGDVVPYDSTCALWLYSAPADEATRVRHAATAGDTLSVIVSSVSNVSYMPFVSANAKKDRVGLAVLGQKGVKWVRSCPGGIAVSKDCGATWSSPQHAYTGRALALDDEEAVVVCMKPAVAMPKLREVKGRGAKGQHATVPRKERTDDWELQPLPRSLRMAVVHDAVLVED